MCPYLTTVLLFDTTVKTPHSLSTNKRLPHLLINLPKLKVHHSLEKMPHTGARSQVKMTIYEQINV